MTTDHMFALAIWMISMPIITAQIYFESSSGRAQSLADNLIRPIYPKLALTLLRTLWSGYSPGVKMFDFVQSPPWRFLEDGVVQQTWPSGQVSCAIYRPTVSLRPEVCRPRWDDNTERFNGIEYDPRYGSGIFTIDGLQTKTIDLLHSDWFVHGQEASDNSIYGFPRIAYGAPIYHMYWYIWSLIGRAFENNTDPGPMVRYPEDDIVQTDDNGDTRRNVDVALDIGKHYRSGTSVALSSEQYTDINDATRGVYKWDIDFKKRDVDFESVMKWIDFLESAKLRSMLMSEMSLTMGSGDSNARNVVENTSNQRDQSQGILMQWMCDHIEQVYLKPAFAMNMPEFQGDVKMRVFGFGQENNDMIRQIVQLAGQDDWRSFGVDVRRIAEAEGFPMTDVAEQAKMLKEAADRAAQQNAVPPPVTPTQGRRAFVTQTGFGEAMYHTLHDPIHVNPKAGLIASLRSQHFDDEANVAAVLEVEGHVERLEARGDALSQEARVDLYLAVTRVLERVYDRQFAFTARDLRLDEREPSRELGHLAAAVPAESAATVVGRTINRAVLDAADRAGVSSVQLLGGERDGQIISVTEALDEVSFYPRLLRGSPEVRRESLDGARARYDAESDVILLDQNIEPDDEREYMLTIGRWLAI